MLVSNNHKNHPCGIQKTVLWSHRHVTQDSVSHPTNTILLVAKGSQVLITQTSTPRISDHALGRVQETQLLFGDPSPPQWVCFSAELLWPSPGRSEMQEKGSGRGLGGRRRERHGKVLGNEMANYTTPSTHTSQQILFLHVIIMH